MIIKPIVVDCYHGNTIASRPGSNEASGLNHPYKRRGLTADRLRSVLAYDRSGTFIWKVRMGPKRAGSIAGFVNADNGHRYISVDGFIYLGQHIAWLHENGEWPQFDVDHKNLNPSDNSWDNLREATPSQNCANRPMRSDSGNPYKGISRKRNRWRALIVIDRRRVHLGYFDTPEEAHAAYMAAALSHHGQFARAA